MNGDTAHTHTLISQHPTCNSRSYINDLQYGALGDGPPLTAHSSHFK